MDKLLTNAIEWCEKEADWWDDSAEQWTDKGCDESVNDRKNAVYLRRVSETAKIKEEHDYLSKFYDVDNYAEMVEIMAKQIERLQKRIPAQLGHCYPEPKLGIPVRQG